METCSSLVHFVVKTSLSQTRTLEILIDSTVSFMFFPNFYFLQSICLLICCRRIEEKNYRGKPRLAYIKQIMNDVGCTKYMEMKRKAERRAEWKAAANQSLD
jgi:hypothetical protein